MKIVFIGAGNVANHLAKALSQRGFEICQIFSRTEASAKSLAEKINTAYTTHLNQLQRDADVYLYAVSDSALPELIEAVHLPDALHVHTSGSTSIDVFKNAEHCGVLYPLQTFSKNKELNFAEIPVFIEAGSETAKDKIYEIARSLTSKLYFMDSEGRRKLHLSAVFACNFVNHLYEIAGELIQETGLDMQVLRPLIEETAEKIKTLSPREAQTGPAARNDRNIMAEHAKLLKDKRQLAALYELISNDIYFVQESR